MDVVGEAYVALRPSASRFAAEAEALVTTGMIPAIAKAGTILAGLFVGKEALSFVRSGIDRIVDLQKASIITDARLKATGNAADVTSDHIKGLAQQEQDLYGIDKVLVQSGENIVLGFKNISNASGGMFDRTIKDATDLSVSLGQEFPEAARNLGRALEAPERAARALRAENIILDSSEQKLVTSMVKAGEITKAQEFILGLVEERTKGVADAYQNSLAASLDKARLSIKDTEAAVLIGLAPALEILASATESSAKFIQGLNPAVRDTAAVALAAGVAYVALARPITAAVGLYRSVRDAAVGSTAAQGEDAAATEANAAAKGEAAIATEALGEANLQLLVSNEPIAFTEAEVAAAMTARADAEYQLLIGNEALIASEVELEAATAAAAAENAAYVATQTAAAGASGGFLIVLAGALSAVGIAAGVYSALNEAVSANTQNVGSYTTALEKNTGTLQQNADEASAAAIEHDGSANLIRKAGISFVDTFQAIRSGTEDWGRLGRAVNAFSTQDGARIPSDGHAIAEALRAAGAESTVFGRELVGAAESGKLTGLEVYKLIHNMEGLHNGLGAGTVAAREHQEVLDAVQQSSRGAAGATDELTIAEKKAALATDDVNTQILDQAKNVNLAITAQQNYTNSHKALDAAQRSEQAAERGVDAANRQVTSSYKGIEDAQRRVVDANDQVDAANRRQQQSIDNVARANQRLTEAENKLAEARKGASQEELGKAALGVESANLRVEESTTNLSQAEADLTKARHNRKTTRLELAQDEERVRAARIALQEATYGVTDSQKALADTQAKGTDEDQAVIDATNQVADAHRAVDDAQQAVTDSAKGVEDAHRQVAAAADGVTTSEQNLADAQQGVNDAQQRVIDSKDAVSQAQLDVATSAGALYDAEFTLKNGVLDATQQVIDQVIALQALESQTDPSSDLHRNLANMVGLLEAVDPDIAQFFAPRASGSSGGPPVRQSAAGFSGTVSSPTRFLIGEGGEPEDVLIVPHSKGGISAVGGATTVDGGDTYNFYLSGQADGGYATAHEIITMAGAMRRAHRSIS